MDRSQHQQHNSVCRRLFTASVCCILLSQTANTIYAQEGAFTNISRVSNNELALRFVAPSGMVYRLDFSTNLTAATNVRWQSLATFQSTGTNQQTDSAAPFFKTRYYRVERVATNALTGDNITTTNGDVVFHPINHASFVMSWNGHTIYNDPVGGAAPYTNLPRADLVLVSHTHTDHYDPATLTAVLATNGIIVGPQAVYTALPTALRNNTVVLTYGAATNLLNVNILAVPGYNSYHPYGANNAYLLTIGGKRILTTGDTGDVPEIRALTNIDVAFVCMNLPFTMTPSDATNDVRAFHPAVVYPYHYRDSSNATTNAAYFKAILGLGPGIEVRLRKWY